MRRPHTLIASATLALLASTAVATPASAIPDPEIVIVHGIPGVRVDLCVDGKEVKRNFRYGQKVKPQVADETRIVLKPRRRGACKGRTIAKLTGFADPGEQSTIVARLKKGKPTLTVLEETNVSAAGAPAAILTGAVVGNGTSFGTVDAWLAGSFTVLAPTPTIAGLKRGKETSIFIGEQFIDVVAWFTKPGNATPLTLPAVQDLQQVERTHFVLVGTKKANLRVVRFKTAFLLP